MATKKTLLAWKSSIVVFRVSVVVALTLLTILQWKLHCGLLSIVDEDGSIWHSSLTKHTGNSPHQTSNLSISSLLRWKTQNRASTVHCVGENFLSNTWRFKSCHFEHMCFDVASKEFVIFESSTHKQPHLAQMHTSKYARSLTSLNQTGLSLGPFRPVFPRKHNNQQERAYFPTVLSLEHHKQRPYFELPREFVWVPFAADTSYTKKRSQILFDYLLPIYNLVEMFGLVDSELLLSILDIVDDLDSPSFFNDFEPYLSMLKLVPNHPRLGRTEVLVKSWLLQLLGPTDQQPLVCAPHAVMGLGAMTDHGVKRGHGNHVTDYQYAQNVGRGPILAKFRSYCLTNAGLEAPETSAETLTSSMTILASISGSAKCKPQHFRTQLSFLHRQLLRSNNDRNNNIINTSSFRNVNFTEHSWLDQVAAVQNASVIVSVMGEGALPAFFLSRGSTLILYYDNTNEFVSSKRKTNRPVMMDWDIWNHVSHVTVHWIPMSSMDSPGSLNVLLNIVQTEMEMHQKDGKQVQIPPKSPNQTSAEVWFGGERVKYVPHSPVSHVHCLGDNFVRNEAPCYRSCHIRYLCLDTDRHEFVIFPSSTQMALDDSVGRLQDNDFAVINSNMMNASVMDGRNIRFSTNQPWFPTLQQKSSHIQGFYLLPKSVFLIPYTLEPSYASNPGHLMWDFFLPFFTLLSMYNDIGDDEIDTKRLMVISIDSECASLPHCKKMVSKFLPLIGETEILTASSMTIDRTQRKGLENEQNQIQSNLVCSDQGAAGIGMLTDHGFTRHGQNLDDYQRVHNSGRGYSFYKFRSFMLNNLLVASNKVSGKKNNKQFRRTRKVVFSVNSTDNLVRRKDFVRQIASVQTEISNVRVEAVELARLSLEEQVELIVDATVFISVVGGSTSIATLLPRDATVVLYFCTEDSFVGKTKKKDFPTMMDFDFWNNASYLRLHWLPTGSMDDPQDMAFLLQLIRTELDSIMSSE